jgi:hypothetical protein
MGLYRRLVRRARWELAGLRRTTVRAAGQDAVRVSRLRGGWRGYRLDDPGARHVVRTTRLRLQLPDAATLVRVAASGLLTGEIRDLRVRLASAPEWLVTGVRPPRLGRASRRFRWRRRGGTLTVDFGWSGRYGVHRALGDALASILRARAWDQASGPVHLLDRGAWLAGGSSWPQGKLAGGPAAGEADELGRPMGPYQALDPPAIVERPVLTALANPFGRKLVGAATPYRLLSSDDGLALLGEGGEVALRVGRGTSPEAAVARDAPAKYAVVTVDSVPPAAAARTLAACGMVFAAQDPPTREALDELGVVTVAHAKEVDDLRGYALSVAASRRMAIAADPALRRTALAGEETLPLPAVSMLLSSMRSEHVENCLRYFTDQTYPALELLVGLHGYELPAETSQRWQSMLPYPVRVVPFPAELPFGAVLGRLSRMADGELVTKLDDDDHYGRHHVTDLVIAWHTSGADVVAKGSRFVHFPELGETIDRAWAAPEVFNVTPAGGTMLLSRSTLQQLGGWSHSPKHVDTDLLIRVKSAGGLVYRTHGLEYVYVRRTTGHTFVTNIDELAQQGERVYHGLPREIIDGHGQPTT